MLPSMKRNNRGRPMPFRHPDFSDEQITKLKESTRELFDGAQESNCNILPLETQTVENDLKWLRRVSTVGNFIDFNSQFLNTEGGQLGDGSYSPTSGDIISLLITQAVQLEQQMIKMQQKLANAEQTIRSKDDEIALLKEKFSNLGTDGSSSNFSEKGCRVFEHQQLVEKCKSLEKQINEMEIFLNDYGMVWIGENDELSGEEDSLEEIPENRQSLVFSGGSWHPDASHVEGFAVDFDRVLKNIEELNLIAGDGVPQIYYTNEGATFKTPEYVPLTLYSNGLVLYCGPFRPYSDPGTQSFVQDIVDGFFPSELQHSYPDGVPFKVVDKRNVMFKNQLLVRRPFVGKGQKLGIKSPASAQQGEVIPDNVHESFRNMDALKQKEIDCMLNLRGSNKLNSIKKINGKISSSKQIINKHSKDSRSASQPVENGNALKPLAENHVDLKHVRKPEARSNKTKTELEISGRKMSADEFLSKLPPAVVRHGKIIDIRSNIAEILKPPKSSVMSHIVENEHVLSDEAVATVKVRSETGTDVYIVNISVEDSVEKLRHLVDQQRSSQTGYRFLCGYPPEVIKNECRSLHECGIIHDSVIYMQSVSRLVE